MATQKVEYIPFADQQVEGDWRVEAIDNASGECFIAIFSGPDCERSAVEYAAFKNGKLMLPAQAEPPMPLNPAPEPVAFSPEAFQVVVKQGFEIVVRPKDLNWSFNAHLNRLSATPKPAIERIGAVKKGKQ